MSGPKLDVSDMRVNDAVARITGLSKRFFVESAPAQPAEDSMAPPSPRDDLRPSAPHIQRQQQYAEGKKQGMATRGDNAAYQYNMPDDEPSQSQKTPKHRMPAKKADGDMYGADDYDDDESSLASKGATTSEARHMNKIMSKVIGPMEDYRRMAGLPELSEGQTGEVPTAGVNKENKRTGGLAGLQGTGLQDIDPKEGPAGEDEVGDAEEETLDNAIAMLKKEGVDTDSLWAEFLERRGLSVDLFNQLIDEAMAGEDPDEMDVLLAVEGMFAQELPRMLPEGLFDMFRKKNAQMGGTDPLKQASAVIKKHGVAAVRAANARGMAVDKMPQRKTSVGQAQGELGRAQSVARRPGGATGSTTGAELGSRLTQRFGPHLVKRRAENEDWTMECDHDSESGEPSMPWAKKRGQMEGLVARYNLTEEKWIQKAIKKPGALHRKLGVPMGKKITAKKINAASKAGGKLGKEANLAKTLKKLRKK